VNVNVLTFPSCWVLAIRLLASDKFAILGVAVNYLSIALGHGVLLSVGISAHCGESNVDEPLGLGLLH
jgi:hypothetical protein